MMMTAQTTGLSPIGQEADVGKTLNLTDKRLAVLRALANYHPCDREPDHHQIAVACGKAYNAADWAHAPLRDLEKAGLVIAVGKRTFGGRIWKITPAGRAALATSTAGR